ncbi:MAG: amidohydrolase family protein [Fuerstiella sp.]|nr:amidohydrolase family protein [Fuerstiella sp.]
MTRSSHLRSLARQAAEDWNAPASDEQTIDVAWWYPPNRPPVRNVRIRYCGGQPVDHSSVPADEIDRILPVAVIPALLNAHTHLEFSTLHEPIGPAVPFPDWVWSVIRWRIEHSTAASDGIRTGLTECHRHAVTAIGEITTSDHAVELLRDPSVEVVSFRELIGLLPDQIPDRIATMNDHLNQLSNPTKSGSVQAGVSPHAPYSVNPELFEAAVDTCASHSAPLAMHLAETTDELELLDTGTGRFVEFLRQMDLWDPDILPRGSTVMRYLEKLAELPRALAVHCNYLTDTEIAFLGQHPQIAVVYCPRTHHYFGHAPHPWQQIQAAGGTVILGTDGRSSNPDLSIWKEIQFLASRTKDVSAADLLPMVTTRSANALGLTDHCSSNPPFTATVIRLPADQQHQQDSVLSPQSQSMARLMSEENRVKLQLCEAVDQNSGN